MCSAEIDTSIVVATCSRVSLLDAALTSLFHQSWAQHHAVEIVVVDDGSTDRTAEYLAALAGSAPLPLRVIQGPAQGIAVARNAGFAAARGRWIASFDDDQLADPDWLTALRQRAETETAVCVGGALRLLLPAGADAQRLGPRVRAILGEHAPFRSARLYTPPSHPATNNALLRRDVFLALGGFDARFVEGGEDKELFRRLEAAGHPIWFEPAAGAGHVTSRSRLQPANLRWTARRVGAADARFALLSGRWRALGAVLLRALSAPVRDLPRLLLPSPSSRLDTLCSLWYTEGLIRGHLILRAPRRRTAGNPFLASLNFRSRNGERSQAPEPLPDHL